MRCVYLKTRTVILKEVSSERFIIAIALVKR